VQQFMGILPILNNNYHSTVMSVLDAYDLAGCLLNRANILCFLKIFS